MEYLPKCATCKEIYSKKDPPQEPPCATCKPMLDEINEDAMMIFSIVQNQFIMGMNGPVDINHLAVWEAIDRYKIKDALGTFRKVLELSRWMIEKINEKN